ncbi:hypothetical protein OKW24_005691 [Peribacillus simplex]|uniref:hypothetical protein n=1 Tax=Peribacillus simplex TaxID=1478 RepID=UPI0024E1C1E6|nr:hypothetical protein [Peribacillus simplex]MDF9763795.1 hypothetical protein [Peribacillus simplex]
MEIYQITHEYAYDAEIWNVTSPMNPEEFELLIAYIQFEVNEIDEHVSLIHIDMVQRVLPLYGCKRTFDDILDDDDHDFDLHWIWESNTGKYDEILKMEKIPSP